MRFDACWTRATLGSRAGCLAVVLLAGLAVALGAARSADRDADLARAVASLQQAINDHPVVSDYRCDHWSARAPERMRLDLADGAAPDVTEVCLFKRSPAGWSVVGGGTVTSFDGMHVWMLSPTAGTATVGEGGWDPHDGASEILHQSSGFDNAWGVGSLTDVLERADVRRLDVNGDALTVRFVVPVGSLDPRSLPECEVEVELGSSPRLVRKTIRWPRSDGSGWRMTDTAVVTRWQQLDGRSLPAVVEQWREDGERTALARYTRLSARTPGPEEVAAWSFGLPPATTWQVRDERRGLSWTTGGRAFTYRGQRYRAPQPIEGHPGEQLAKLVEESEHVGPE
ncbi:MAG: hypothetical protein KDA22_03595 [Phycisphaerales bacterium]|nr:hypothetical protein [Phycisphaerales bacterium]